MLCMICFTLFLEGSIGVLILAFLIFFPIFSTALTLYCSKRVYVTLTVEPLAEKGRPTEITTKTEKTTRLPLPFLRYTITPDAHFEELGKDVQLALGLDETEQRVHTFTPLVCGKALIEIQQLRLTGYLGFLNRNIRQSTAVSILILPKVPELQSGNRLFHTICSSTIITEEEEETQSAALGGTNTIAGYEHREYVPGDLLKRINWKLSSKKDTLMVRLDESLSIAKTSVVLDFHRSSDMDPTLEQLKSEEIITEGALGMLSLCAGQGMGCSFFYTNGAQWRETAVDAPAQAEQLAVTVMEEGFCRLQQRIPDALLQNTQSGVYLVFTNAPDRALITQAMALQGDVHIIVPAGTIAMVPEPLHLWNISKDYRIFPAGQSDDGKG